MSEGAARPRASTTTGKNKEMENIRTPQEVARLKDRSEVEACEKTNKPESWLSSLQGKLFAWWSAALRFQEIIKIMGVLGFFGAFWTWVPAMIAGFVGVDDDGVR